MSPRLGGVGVGSFEGRTLGTLGTDISRGGNHHAETEVGSNCEAAPYEEGEDSPPSYAEVAGAGADFQFRQVGEETFV